MLQHIEKILATGSDVTCFDISLVAMQEIANNAGLVTDYKSALKRSLKLTKINSTEPAEVSNPEAKVRIDFEIFKLSSAVNFIVFARFAAHNLKKTKGVYYLYHPGFLPQ